MRQLGKNVVLPASVILRKYKSTNMRSHLKSGSDRCPVSANCFVFSQPKVRPRNGKRVCNVCRTNTAHLPLLMCIHCLNLDKLITLYILKYCQDIRTCHYNCHHNYPCHHCNHHYHHQNHNENDHHGHMQNLYEILLS